MKSLGNWMWIEFQNIGPMRVGVKLRGAKVWNEAQVIKEWLEADVKGLAKRIRNWIWWEIHLIRSNEVPL